MQKKVWLDCGGVPGEYDWDVYQKFADQVGWRRSGNWLSYDELTFLLDGSEKAHLPIWVAVGWTEEGRKIKGESSISLFSRRDL